MMKVRGRHTSRSTRKSKRSAAQHKSLREAFTFFRPKKTTKAPKMTIIPAFLKIGVPKFALVFIFSLHLWPKSAQNIVRPGR